MPAPLMFLPEPRSLRLLGGEFVIDASTRIRIPDSNPSFLRTAESLKVAIYELTGLNLGIEVSDTGEQTGGDIAFRLEAADSTPQGYAIECARERVVVRAGDEAGLFYGVQTLIQLAKNRGRSWPCLSIDDSPVLSNRGVMLDVSRGKVPTLETLEQLTRTLAHYKFNQFQLYFEHTFAFPSHPEISEGADPLTPDDIRELDAHCRDLHIELIPNLQSIGHQRPLLSLPQFQHLAETEWHWSFASVSDDGFALLDELYGEMMAAFSSNKFNVNADEPWDFGRGKSRELVREIGLGRVYLEHVKRLHRLVTGRGKQMLMWADMFWHYPELVGELPDDILLLDWWYEAKERYDTVDVLKNADRRFYVCAATSSWSTLYPRMENSISNILGFVRAGVGAGAEGMIVSDWGDNGHFQPLSNSWYAYLLSADAGWTGAATPLEAFDAAFGELFLGDGSGRQVAAMRRLGAAMQVAPDWMNTWHSAMALFENPISGKIAAVSSPEQVAEAKEAAEEIQGLLWEIRDSTIRHDLGFAASQIIFACDKVETTREIWALLADASRSDISLEPDNERFGRAITNLNGQSERLPAMAAEFEARWLAHARRSEIQQNLDRYAMLVERYKIAIAWLEEQRERFAKGLPVDSELATYDRGDYAVLHEATRKQIRELVDIIGIDTIPPDLIPWVDPPV